MKQRERRRARGVRCWPCVALVLVLSAPPLLALWLAPRPRELVTTTAVVELVLDPIALAAGLLLYLHWRIKRRDRLGWLSLALVASATKGISLAATRLVLPEEVQSHSGWLLALDIVFGAGLLAMVLLLRRRPPPADPALLGLALGLSVAGIRLGTLFLDTPRADPALLVAGNIVLLALHVAFAWAVLRIGLQATWANALPVAVLLLCAGQAISQPAFGASYADTAALVANVAGAMLLSGTALVLLYSTMRVSATAVDELHHRVAEVEEGVRADRERLHEINATIAGIATATRLVHDRPDLAPDSKHLLEDMLASEIDRLERLVAGRTPSREPVDLDRTIGTIVVAQQAMGRDVRWTPSGLHTCGHSDDITEVLTTLLNNAAEHAPGSPVTISTRTVAARVEITVADHGPGVSSEMADRIFEWGERSRDSHGQGIGLFVARRLIQELDGSLFVLPAQAGSGRGAVFVITLPVLRNPHGASHARAQ
jgi:signal transduction histidine kinase